MDPTIPLGIIAGLLLTLTVRFTWKRWNLPDEGEFWLIPGVGIVAIKFSANIAGFLRYSINGEEIRCARSQWPREARLLTPLELMQHRHPQPAHAAPGQLSLVQEQR